MSASFQVHRIQSSASLSIWEIQIKTTSITSHLLGWLLSKSQNIKMLARMWRTENCWWKCRLIYLVWKTLWVFLKKIVNRTTVWFSNLTAGYISKGNEESYMAIGFRYPLSGWERSPLFIICWIFLLWKNIGYYQIIFLFIEMYI